ncbi:MAG: hypothetical protein Q4P07_09005 [Ornithinimicrobium sp.]|uniref:hypothetical protein n=1 Tax=Ornithinimicrobium sp. TaxID=1977084 RepID=UPI0026DFCDF2|nr:hypothetical protein [Ornithinimicrobium sp.]MDO5740274.1 hypothetical protein [Ornithinimicrobium sp.]
MTIMRSMELPVAGEGDGRSRRAVVLIHGIGEQRPTGTLRGFVDGLGVQPAWSKPDRVSDNLELRRMAVYQPGELPTDLYELYWAHHAPESSPVQVLAWMGRLLSRGRRWKGSPVAPLLAVVSLVAGLALIVAIAIAVVTTWQHGFRAWLTTPPFWVSLAVAMIQPLTRRVLTRRIADAERYLTPDPANIKARNAIRAEGVELLRRLHQAGLYDQLVVVGHSLGSVIGYDILRLYWDEARHPTFEKVGPAPEAERFAIDFGNPLGLHRGEVEIFQHVQHRLWREQRARGVPWLVTDFVTLGSPLAHGSLILDTPDASLTRRQDDLEFPTCPPMPSLNPAEVDDDREAAFYRTILRRGTQEREVLVGNHGALFGPTRWTNLYFPVRHVLGGDLVAGPLAGVFGTGIRDVAVHHSGRIRPWWRRFSPVRAHVSYWAPLDRPIRTRAGTVEAVPALRRVIGLG